jgi:uncharacterized protein
MQIDVRNAQERSRYEVLVDGQVVGVADYRIYGDVVVMPHTEVVPEMRRRGLAARLVAHALDDVRAAGQRVDPRCWYVAGFIDDHPEYADLRAAA